MKHFFENRIEIKPNTKPDEFQKIVDIYVKRILQLKVKSEILLLKIIVF